jgi:hypothetical protein
MDRFIPILSLLIAAIAVFVGPAISVYIAKRQIRASSEIANEQIRMTLKASSKQITAPMRQAWINCLRNLLAEISSSALHYYVAGFEERTDREYQRLTLIQSKIQLMLNPKEDDHKRLEALISQMISALEYKTGPRNEFQEIHPQVIALSRAILKREWDVVKDPIPFSGATKSD